MQLMACPLVLGIREREELIGHNDVAPVHSYSSLPHHLVEVVIFSYYTMKAAVSSSGLAI